MIFWNLRILITYIRLSFAVPSLVLLVQQIEVRHNKSTLEMGIFNKVEKKLATMHSKSSILF